MHDLTPIISTVTAAFLASFVEVVEAFTIVLAVGVTRSWRPALTGTALALVVLAALVLAFGPLLALVPISTLQFVVGVLLILFGMRWLRKAILRSVGVIALHDEDAAFSKETAELNRQASDKRADYLAGLAAFKAVLLEGVEVVFIVIAVGAAHGEIGHTQFLPGNVLKYGVGSGNLRDKATALASTANFLKAHGWRAGASAQSNLGAIAGWNDANVYQQAIARIATAIDGD